MKALEERDRFIFKALMERMKGLVHDPSGCLAQLIDDSYVVTFDGMEIIRLPYYTPAMDDLRREGALMEIRRMWYASQIPRPYSPSIRDFIERTGRDYMEMVKLAEEFEIDLDEELAWTEEEE